MGKIAFLFAGQGAQYPGMGQEIAAQHPAAQAIFDQLEALHPGLQDKCFTSSKEELAITINTQPCLFAADLAIAEAVRAAGIIPDAVAGFSLGEIPALTFAGLFSVADGFQLVCHRAQFMQTAAEANPGTMYAVLKLSSTQVANLCSPEQGLYPANFNSPGQTAVGGKPEALAQLVQPVRDLGGKTMPLAVSGAFHTPCMDTAAVALDAYLTDKTILAGTIPVYANKTAAPYTAATGKALIAQQVNHPVQWQTTIETMVAAGIDTFIEVGPGKTLTGLVKKINDQANAFHVEKHSDLEALIAVLSE